jgi:hypothetical protein
LWFCSDATRAAQAATRELEQCRTADRFPANLLANEI